MEANVRCEKIPGIPILPKLSSYKYQILSLERRKCKGWFAQSPEMPKNWALRMIAAGDQAPPAALPNCVSVCMPTRPQYFRNSAGGARAATRGNGLDRGGALSSCGAAWHFAPGGDSASSNDVLPNFNSRGRSPPGRFTSPPRPPRPRPTRVSGRAAPGSRRCRPADRAGNANARPR